MGVVDFTIHIPMQVERKDIRKAAKKVMGKKYKFNTSLEECILACVQDEFEDCDKATVTINK